MFLQQVEAQSLEVKRLQLQLTDAKRTLQRELRATGSIAAQMDELVRPSTAPSAMHASPPAQRTDVPALHDVDLAAPTVRIINSLGDDVCNFRFMQRLTRRRRTSTTNT